MKHRRTFRMVATGFIWTGLLVTALAAGSRIFHRSSELKIGTENREFYVKGNEFLNQRYDSPKWKDLIHQGLVPYHRVVAEDFREDDSSPINALVYSSGFFKYEYRTRVTKLNKDSFKAELLSASVYSGLDRNKSWHRSSMKDPGVYLNHEQGHSDLFEVSAKTFAALLKTRSLIGVGETAEGAARDLDNQVTSLCSEVEQANGKAQEEYDRDTLGGTNTSAQIKAFAQIQEVLVKADIRPKWSPEIKNVIQ